MEGELFTSRMPPAIVSRSPLVISASRATDIPAFHGEWFMARLRGGLLPSAQSLQ